MATSTKWRLNASANNGAAGALGVGSLELRSAAGVARPFVRDFFTVSATHTGTANILGAASLTAVVSSFEAYSWHQLTFPFPVILGGVSYATCVVTSDGQISFGEDGSTYGWDYNQVENLPKGFPSIIHSPGADSGFSGFKKLYAGAENSGSTYRIRLEMFAQDTDPGGTADTIWEVTFDSAVPNQARVDFLSSGYAAGPYGLIKGVSDGYYRAYAADFASGVVNAGYDVVTTLTSAEAVFTASSTFPPDGPPYGFTYGAEQACDNTTDTEWLTASGNSTGWLQVEFGSPFTVAQYVVSAPSHNVASATNHMPRDWTLEYWDGSAWQVMDTQTSQTGWAYSEARSFSIATTNDGNVTLPQFTLEGLHNVPTDTYLGNDLAIAPLTANGTVVRGNDGAVNLGNPANSGPSFDATPFALSGVSIVGRAMAGDAYLDALWTVSGSLDGPMPLQALTLNASGVAGTVAAGDSAFPIPTAAAAALTGVAAAGDVTLPALTLEGGDEAVLPLPMFTLTAAGMAGRLLTGDVTLPGLTLDADTGNHGAIDLPAPTLQASGMAGALLAGSLTLPALMVEGGQEAEMALPLLALSGDGASGTIGTGSAAIERLALSGVMAATNQPASGDITLTAPSMDAALATGAVAAGDAAFDRITLSADLAAGIQSTGDIVLPVLALAATSIHQGQAAGDLTLAPLAVLSAGSGSVVATGSITLAEPTLAADAVRGNLGSASITVPLLALDADGHASTVGDATISLPVLLMGSAMIGGEAGGISSVTLPAVSFTGVVVNTRLKAATTYSGLAFNSLATFNGLVLAATADGIVALTGGTDDGTPIDARVAGGVSDFGSAQRKRVLAGYVGYRTGGDLELTLISDEHHEYVYTLQPRNLDALHTSRVKFGRGATGKYWQWKLSNRNGADFALDSVSLDAANLSRKVG